MIAKMKRVYAFWSLNGKLTEEGLKRKIDEMRSIGYEGVILHARGGLETEYFSDEWFSFLRYAAVYAHSVGMDAFLYDENGWPSGYAGGRVPQKDRSFRQSFIEFSDLSEKGRENDERCETIAEYPEEGKVAYRKYNPYYTNLLESRAVDEFIACTYERYKKELGDLFGREIGGIFTDEPQLSNFGYPVYDGLFSDFEEEYGYSLKPVLYRIDRRDGSDAVRYDYRRLIAKKYTETYAGKLGAWCRENDLVFTGHMAAEDGLYFQIQTQADVMPSYLSFTVPGIDVLGNRLPTLTLLKQVSSVAEQSGEKDVLAETFGASGHGATPRELLNIRFYEAMYGVSTACIHLSAYSLRGRRKRDYPPDFSGHLEYFGCLAGWMKSISFLGELAREGKRKTDVLLIDPIGSFWGKYANRRVPLPQGKCTYEDKLREMGVTEDLSEITVNYLLLQQRLAAIGADYHIGNEFVLSSAYAEGKDLVAGGYRYRTAILPYGAEIGKGLADLLARFAEQGGLLLFTAKLPRVANGNDVFGKLFREGKIHPLSLGNGQIGKQFACYGIAPVATIYDGESRFAAEDIVVTARETDNGTILFVFNTCRYPRTLYLNVCGREKYFRLGGEENAVLTLGDEFSVYYPLSGNILPLSDNFIFCDFRSVFWDPAVRYPGDNVLPVDICRAVICGRTVAEGYFIDVNEAVYKEIETGSVTEVTAEYRFTVGELPETLAIAAESAEELTDVKLNGNSLTKTGRKFYHEEISVYDGKKFAVSGENTISLVYRIDTHGLKKEISAFETESNVYFRKTEIESVYVIGNFSLFTEGTFRERKGKKYFSVKSCTIGKGCPGRESEAPFYLGKVLYEGSFFFPENKAKEDRVLLSLKSDYPVCELTVNGKNILSYGGEIDVTDAIAEGNNELTVTAHTGNRNLAGPHRYFDCDTEYVGPSTFLGKRGWEDNFNTDTPYPLIPPVTRTEERIVAAYSVGSRIGITIVKEEKG